MKYLHLPVRACGIVLLLVTWVCYHQPHSPEACCHLNFGARQVHGGSLEDHTSSRPCFVEDGLTGSLHKWSGPRQRRWGICMQWGLARKPSTGGSGIQACRLTRKLLLTANYRRLHLGWAQRWQYLTMAHSQLVIFCDESRFQLYPVDGRLEVCRSPGECFRQRCQAYRLQSGGVSVHIWGAFHNGAKSYLVIPNWYLANELYRGHFTKGLSAICEVTFLG